MARLLTDFESALPALSKAVFSQPIDKTDNQKVNIRPVLLKGELRYQLESFRDNKAFHRNVTGEELLKTVENQLTPRPTTPKPNNPMFIKHPPLFFRI